MSEAEFQHPQEQLFRLLAGKWITAAIAAAAELGVADALGQDACTLEELAARLRCDAAALQRLLRVLGGEGLLSLDSQQRYRLTELGAQLQEGKLRELARFVGGTDFAWAPWTRLCEAVQSGRSAFELTTGQPLFEYLDSHPEQAALYNRGVDNFTRMEARALAQVFDFSGVRSLVDVGGGLGTLLAEVGARFPSIERCVLLDRPAVVEAARRGPAAAALGARLQVHSGDFFSSVPPADAYVIKHVLHNWEDEFAVRILRNCRAGLSPGGYILVVEGILLPGLRRDRTAMLDLEMFVLCGRGAERTKPQFRKLFAEAGLRLRSTHDLAGTTRLLVAEATRPRT